FFPTPHVRVTWQLIVTLYVAWLAYGAAPLVMFYRSIRCKRVLFNPTIFDRAFAGSNATAVNEWNVYRFEKEAFQQVGLSEPRELEGQPWVPWLLGAIYGIAMITPIAVTAVTVEGVAHGGFVLLFLLGCGLFLTIKYFGGLHEFVSTIRRFFAQVT